MAADAGRQALSRFGLLQLEHVAIILIRVIALALC